MSLDLVKLHAVLVNTIASKKDGELRSAEKKLCKRLQQLNKEIEDIRADYTESTRRNFIPRLSCLHNEIKGLQQKLSSIQDEMKKDHLTEYYLFALPILNTYHVINEELKYCGEKRRDELLVDKEKLIDDFVRVYYPTMRKRVSHKARIKRDNDVGNISCSPCCNANMVQSEDHNMICSQCGITLIRGGISLSNPRLNLSYNRPMTTTKMYSYRRINHLRELLRSLLGRSNISIGEENLEKVKAEVRKHTFPIEKLNAIFIRKVLKKLKLNQFYEQSTAIARMLNPKLELLNIDPYYEEKLILQFVSCERPFELTRHKVDKTRRNFLSYSYVFFRLNELNGRHDLNQKVQLLKSTKLIVKQDQYWKLICKKNKWEYLGNCVG